MIKNSKISIGSANFGQNYGFFKKNNLDKNEFKKVIKFCKKNNVYNFDTASRYKKSEDYFNLINKASYKPCISTKLPSLPKNIKNFNKWVNNSLFKSMKKINIDKIEVLYFGDSFNFNSSKDIYIYKRLYNELLELKKKNYISKIGYSTYNYNFINNKDFIPPDVIQAPFNIIDQRILQKNIMKYLKKNKIKIYIRSIFLQGILLMNYNLDNNFKHLSQKLQLIDFDRNKLNINKLDFNLNFINYFNFYDQIIIGINSAAELNDIINFNHIKNFKINRSKYMLNDERVIDPRKWN